MADEKKKKQRAARKPQLTKIKEQLAEIKEREKQLLELQKQAEQKAAVEIGKIVIEHLKNGKPFDDEFKNKVSSLIG